MINFGSDLSGTSTIELELKFPELNHTVNIYAKCHMSYNLFHYNLILGREHKT